MIYLAKKWWYVPWHCCCPSEGPDHHGPAHLDGGVALCATHCLTRTARQYDEHWPMSALVVWKPWGFSWEMGFTMQNGDWMGISSDVSSKMVIFLMGFAMKNWTWWLNWDLSGFTINNRATRKWDWMYPLVIKHGAGKFLIYVSLNGKIIYE